MRDLASNINIGVALVPAVLTATTKGNAMDLMGVNGAVFVVNAGAIVGAGLFTSKIQDSDTTTDADFTDVAAGDQVGTFQASLAASSVTSVGYIGHKRYARVVLTKVSGTSLVAGAIVIVGALASRPVA